MRRRRAHQNRSTSPVDTPQGDRRSSSTPGPDKDTPLRGRERDDGRVPALDDGLVVRRLGVGEVLVDTGPDLRAQRDAPDKAGEALQTVPSFHGPEDLTLPLDPGQGRDTPLVIGPRGFPDQCSGWAGEE